MSFIPIALSLILITSGIPFSTPHADILISTDSYEYLDVKAPSLVLEGNPSSSSPWWERTNLDKNRNRVTDSLEKLAEKEPETLMPVYLAFNREIKGSDIEQIERDGWDIGKVFWDFDLIGLMPVPSRELLRLSNLDGVALVVPKGTPTFYSDIANPAVKAKQSDEYSPYTAWELGYSGKGVNIAIMDTGIDNGHPSLRGKWIGGVDFTKPDFFLTPRDGTYDADDTQGHGTTCAGIATGTGAPDGVYMGTASQAKLVDVRIGSTLGGSPGEFPFAQDFYDAALEGIEWAIEHKDDQWEGQNPENHGIDIISLSWGIYPEEDPQGGSDGTDPYSLALDRAVEQGIIVVVAAGNEGPDNEGLWSMGAASNVITIAATDDQDTITRDDDVIASYSSRGPRADNNDGNPFDELKPDVAAPGTGITQVEYDRFGDGSGNGYGSRGSGTSYAAPLVAGIVAMLLEANPNLSNELVKEILRFSAERRGDATFLELDPFWNREFGWGIVDAYEALKVVERIEEPKNIDVNLQNFVLNITVTENGDIEVSGIAWARFGEVEEVQVRIDDGEWKTVQPIGKGSNNTWSEWSYTFSSEGLEVRNHTIQARAIADEKESLIDEQEFTVERIYGDEESNLWPLVMGIFMFLLAVTAIAVYYKKRR